MGRHHDRGILAIALFKMVKALLLVLAGTGLLTLLRPNAVSEVREWMLAITMRQGQEIIGRLLRLLDVATPGRITVAGLAAICYGVLFATEGIGLWLERRWAEYLTIGATASLIPLELYEVVHRVTLVRSVALAANTAGVAYLVYRLRHPQGVRLELT